jgi:hypothetical protein
MGYQINFRRQYCKRPDFDELAALQALYNNGTRTAGDVAGTASMLNILLCTVKRAGHLTIKNMQTAVPV